MVPGMDSARLTLARLPLLYCAINAFCVTFAIAAFIPFSEMEKSDLLPSLIFMSITGLTFGILAKYRSNYSVSFSLWATVYAACMLAIIFGGAMALAFSDVAGLHEIRLWILAFYLLSIIAPFAFGIFSRLRTKREARLKNEKEWRAEFGRSVDFDGLVIKSSDDEEAMQPGAMRSVIFSVIILVANVPIFFDAYLESRNKMILIVLPVLVGIIAYFGAKKVGPRVANLLLLRQYEKQTGRLFVNADYEKIQELRRTFFLSRWLMKDYRRAAGQ